MGVTANVGDGVAVKVAAMDGCVVFTAGAICEGVMVAGDIFFPHADSSKKKTGMR